LLMKFLPTPKKEIFTINMVRKASKREVVDLEEVEWTSSTCLTEEWEVNNNKEALRKESPSCIKLRLLLKIFITGKQLKSL